MTPEQIEKLRAQFEAWALTQGMAIERYPPHHPTWPGQYMWTTPHRDWTVWQACSRLVAQDTWERAAKIPERRRDARFEEHGTTEHDTGASYYSGRAAEMYDALDEEDEDVAAEIRAAAAKEKS